MRKLFKCRKALSPVVAAIILIAVTVAVSIAVAAWMGALTFTFMKTEEVKVTSMVFWGTSNNYINVTVLNPGTAKVTLGTLKINDVTQTSISPALGAIEAGQSATYVVTKPWVSGQKYKVTLLSSSGTPVGAYEATA